MIFLGLGLGGLLFTLTIVNTVDTPIDGNQIVATVESESKPQWLTTFYPCRGGSVCRECNTSVFSPGTGFITLIYTDGSKEVFNTRNLVRWDVKPINRRPKQ
jgi:hypothetical protein